MKWIKTRKKYLTDLNEAKIKDLVLKRQEKIVSDVWGKKWLEYEEIDPTDNIKQGKWKLSEEDKNMVLNYFFGSYDDPINIDNVFNIFDSLEDHFANTLLLSLDLDLLKEDQKIIMENFNPKKPTIDQLTLLFDPVFRKLSINDTKGDNMLKKDKDGRPIKDEEGNMIRIEKEKGAPIFDNNLVGIRDFIDSYNKSYKTVIDDFKEIDDYPFSNRDISSIINIAKNNHNHEYKFDFKIFDKDMYLKIIHNPKDILNISISKFYSSCQHLYTGGYKDQVLPNVFDPNSIPAFLYFDSDIFWDDDKISDFLPISRMIIRNVENKENELKIYFDKCYPDRLEKTMSYIIEKYSDNKNTVEDPDYETYIFSPDIDFDDDIRQGYHDRFSRTKKVKMIGKNAKKIHLNRNYDWSEIKISPNAKLKEIIIETDDLPSNFLELDLKPDWIKFRFMEINNFKPFDKIITKEVSFDKCKLTNKILNELNEINPDLEKLQVISCDLQDDLNISSFDKLKELHLIYTLDSITEISGFISDSIEKLVISGDLVSSKEGKEYINELKRKGIKVETVGPVI